MMSRKRTFDMSYCADQEPMQVPMQVQPSVSVECQLLESLRIMQCAMSSQQILQQQVLDKLGLLLDEITKLSHRIMELDTAMCQQRYVIADLKKEISDLQTHAIHGAFQAQVQAQEDQDMSYI
jgi:hypothetical protein